MLLCLCRIYSPVQDTSSRYSLDLTRHPRAFPCRGPGTTRRLCVLYPYTNAILALEPRQTPTITRSRSHFHRYRPQNLYLPFPPAPHTSPRDIGLVCMQRMHMHEHTYLTFLEDGVRDFSAELCPKPAFQTRVKQRTFSSGVGR